MVADVNMIHIWYGFCEININQISCNSTLIPWSNQVFWFSELFYYILNEKAVTFSGITPAVLVNFMRSFFNIACVNRSKIIAILYKKLNVQVPEKNSLRLQKEWCRSVKNCLRYRQNSIFFRHLVDISSCKSWIKFRVHQSDHGWLGMI